MGYVRVFWVCAKEKVVHERVVELVLEVGVGRVVKKDLFGCKEKLLIEGEHEGPVFVMGGLHV